MTQYIEPNAHVAIIEGTRFIARLPSTGEWEMTAGDGFVLLTDRTGKNMPLIYNGLELKPLIDGPVGHA